MNFDYLEVLLKENGKNSGLLNEEGEMGNK